MEEDSYEIKHGLLKQKLSLQYQKLIETIPSSEKVLIFDSHLRKIINLFTSIDHKNCTFKEFTQFQGYTENCFVFFMRNDSKSVKRLRLMINEVGQSGRKKIYVVFAPKCDLFSRNMLDGVLNQENILEFHFDLIPIDKDLFSLEMPDCFRKMHVDKDYTVLKYVRHSIQRLELVYGRIDIRKIISVGEMANRVHREVEAKPLEFPTEQDGNIDCLILIDRKVDLITPLCTQSTYEGLLDDVYGIQQGIKSISLLYLSTCFKGVFNKVMVWWLNWTQRMEYLIKLEI